MPDPAILSIRSRIVECQDNLAVKYAQISALAAMDKPYGPVADEIDTLCAIVDVLLKELQAAKLARIAHLERHAPAAFALPGSLLER